MTPREKKLAVALVLMTKAYNDSNPDVGMGPSIYSLTKDCIEPLGFDLDEIRLIAHAAERAAERAKS
jgi:hypothetical protein